MYTTFIWRPAPTENEPTNTLNSVARDFLLPTNPVPLQVIVNLSQVLIRHIMRQGKKVLVRVGIPSPELRFAAQYRWKDGSKGFL